MLTSADWTRYKNTINSAHGMFNQDILTWVKYEDTVPRFNEETTDKGTPVPLKVLLGFNYFRTWPLTKHDESGELDNQNMVAYINRKYLNDLGYLTPQGYLNFRPDRDFFFHRGIRYKVEGDTFLSQAQDDPLHILLILRREELVGGEKLHYQTSDKTTILEGSRIAMVVKTLEPTF